MHLEDRLLITVGQATDAGAKSANEDCLGVRLPDEPLLTMKGIAAVIADGVSNAEAGREASESCVQSFLTDYYSTPDSWTVRTSVQKVLTALNRWLYGQGQRYLEAHRGYVSTLSILILKSHTAHLVHVGDSRIYLLRDGCLEQLTTDHATWVSEERTYLTRAMGMDVALDIDYRTLEFQRRDVFLLTTDGIHDFLDRATLTEFAAKATQGDEVRIEGLCRELMSIALERGSQDNLSCQLLRIDGLPLESADDLYQKLTELPFPPPLSPGMIVDGYRIEEELHASSRSQLYRVRDTQSGESLVMKTPSVNFDDDPAYIERFVMEPWIGRRIESPHVARVVVSERRSSCLYYLQEYVEGRSLAAWISDHSEPVIADVIEIVDQIARGLRAFHRRETLHQDLKPDNVMIDDAGRACIVDFGSCHVAGVHEITAPITRDRILGTASYAAPECRLGEQGGIRAELFSLAVISYEMLTGGALPYDEQLERATSSRHFERLDYVPAYHRNPMVPVWMDGALRKALQIDPARRYGEISEFLYDLRHPNPRFTRETPLPLVERDPLRFWRIVALLLALSQLATLWLLLR